MNVLYLIDFGCSQQIIKDGEHVQMKGRVKFRGNVIFASINNFLHQQISRRDDIISFCYVLGFLMNSKIHWVDRQRPLSEQFYEISEFKQNTPARKFFRSHAQAIGPLLEYAYELEFEERPNYNKIRWLLKKMLLD